MTAAEVFCAAYFLTMFIPMICVPFETTSKFLHLIMNSAALIAAAGAHRIRFTFVRVFIPLLLAFFAYRQVHYLWFEFNPCNYDAQLQRIDSYYFAFVTDFVEAIKHRVVSDVMAIAYVSYYPVVAVTTVYFLCKKMEWTAHRYMSLMTLLLLLSFVGYYFIPAKGPHFFTGREEVLDGLGLAKLIHSMIMQVEWPVPDAFPSGHVMVNVASLWFVWRHNRFLFRIYFLPVILLVISTVYMRYHYVVDVAAGLALVPICIVLNDYFCKVQKRRSIMSADVEDSEKPATS